MNLGSKILIKYTLITVIVFFGIPPLLAIVWGIFDKTVLPPEKIIKNFFGFSTEELIGISISVGVILILMILFGQVYERAIKRSNRILINAITILVIWMILLFSCAIVDSFIRKIKHNLEEFEINGWVVYGIGTFFLLACINFLVIGFWMGREIKK